MATGSHSIGSWESLPATAAALVSPPRILPPLRRSHETSSNNPTIWDFSHPHASDRRHSDAQPFDAPHEYPIEHEARHLTVMKLPPLDTSQSSHRFLANDQSPPAAQDHFSSKRRRIGEREGASPNQNASFAELSRPRGRPTPSSQADYQVEALGRAQIPAQHDAAWALGSSHTERTSRDTNCCLPACQGQTCSRLRSIVRDLVTEVCSRDVLGPLAAPSSDHLPPKPILPEATEIGLDDALEWALQRLKWNNVSLRNYLNSNKPNSYYPPEAEVSPPLFRHTPPFGNQLERMKRQYEIVDKDADPTSQQLPRPYQSPAEQSGQSSVQSQDPSWRPYDAMDPPGHPNQRHHRSASFSYGPPFTPQGETTQSARMLPSPSSLNLPMPPSLPSISSPSLGSTSSAHLAHLHDLQHQVSVKQLALQTLRREYDSLLQKLERQRTRSQAMEKKSEVSDAEINSLTDEKERLAGQVQVLETQVDELQQSRDEARKVGADSAAQYMKIVEMAGRLQGKGVDDKKSWEQERSTLLARISELEGGLGASQMQHPFGGSRSLLPPADIEHASSTSGGGGNDTTALKHEVLNLQERISALENALKAAVDQGRTIRAAALTLASVGQRLETTVNSALGGPQEGEDMETS